MQNIIAHIKNVYTRP